MNSNGGGLVSEGLPYDRWPQSPLVFWESGRMCITKNKRKRKKRWRVWPWSPGTSITLYGFGVDSLWAFMASGNFGGSGSSCVTTYDGTHLMQSHNLLDLMGDSLSWCNPTFFNPWWETGLMQYHILLDWAQTSYPQLYDERLSWCKLTFL